MDLELAQVRIEGQRRELRLLAERLGHALSPFGRIQPETGSDPWLVSNATCTKCGEPFEVGVSTDASDASFSIPEAACPA